MVLVLHRVQQGLPTGVAGQPGPGRPPHEGVFGDKVVLQVAAEHAPPDLACRWAGRGVDQLVQVAT
jgi:hypothetical protein